LQQASQDVAKAKKIMRECEGTVPTTSKWLRMEIEQNFLEPYGVTRAAYHGGDLVGPSVKSLMANADDIFSTLEAFLLDVAEENGILIEDEIEQVRARLQVYRLVLKNFDGLFSLLRDKESQLNINEKTVQLAKFLDAAMLCWCRLNISITPKLHIVEDHLLDVIAHIETLQYFDEEFVERAHQKGLKYNRITKGMTRNPIRKYNYMVRWEMARSQSVLERSKKRLSLKSKRGGKRRKTERGAARKASRDITLEELHDLQPHIFQRADEMNVIIAKRLAGAGIA